MTKTSITLADAANANGTPHYSAPKYTSTFINQANQNAQSTHPVHGVVGNVSSDIQKFKEDSNLEGHSVDDWKRWHSEHYPNAIKLATNKTWKMYKQMLKNLKMIKKEDVQSWIEDFVYTKTYNGLMVQKAIIMKIAEEIGTTYRLATIEEERQQIDGFINGHAIQIKPDSYQHISVLINQNIDCTTVIYEKKDGLITFEYNPEDFQ